MPPPMLVESYEVPAIVELDDDGLTRHLYWPPSRDPDRCHGYVVLRQEADPPGSWMPVMRLYGADFHDGHDCLVAPGVVYNYRVLELVKA